MTVTKKGDYCYGDNLHDLQEVLLNYSDEVGYRIDHFKNALCSCGNATFIVLVNEDEGVAARICTSCEAEHGIGDSDEYMDQVETIEEMECLCGSNEFQITAGVSLYKETDDVRWFYLGLFCPSCHCLGCYAEWKSEYFGYKKLLDNI